MSFFPEDSVVEKSIQLAPFHSPPLYPGQRYISYAILDSTVPNPTFVEISGVGPDGPMELKVAIAPENIVAKSTKPLLHVMAARKLVQDIQNETSWLHVEPGQEIPVAKAKAEIVRLGTTCRYPADPSASWRRFLTTTIFLFAEMVWQLVTPRISQYKLRTR
ncbi:hypothetical protein HDU93_009923 [Gonapodya sp. JEL0774]|nr:hypothetical protein HDU93_009923 [Gonapodya sp. JEL0774]